MFVYYSYLIVVCCSNATFTTWPVMPRNRATICFDVLLSQRFFVGLGFSWKTHAVDFCFVPGSYAQIHVLYLCKCYTQPLIKHVLIYFTFLCTNRYEPFFKRLSNYAGSYAILFYCQTFKQYVIDTHHINIQRSHGMSHNDLAVIVHAKHRYFLSEQPV